MTLKPGDLVRHNSNSFVFARIRYVVQVGIPSFTADEIVTGRAMTGNLNDPGWSIVQPKEAVKVLIGRRLTTDQTIDQLTALRTQIETAIEELSA